MRQLILSGKLKGELVGVWWPGLGMSQEARPSFAREERAEDKEVSECGGSRKLSPRRLSPGQ